MIEHGAVPADGPEAGVPIAPFDAFQIGLQSYFPDSRFGAIKVQQDGSQELLVVTSPEAVDLFRLALYETDVREQEAAGKKSSGIGLFNVNLIDNNLREALQIWQEGFPGYGLPQGIEMHKLVFRTPESAQSFWNSGVDVLNAYDSSNLAQFGHEEIYRKMMHEIAARRHMTLPATPRLD